MGYYTYYNLSVFEYKNNTKGEEVKNQIDFKKEICDIYHNGSQGLCFKAIEWHNWEKDMLEFSKKYPDLLFQLNGEGEDNDDIWVAYFIDGKCQYSKVKLILDSFDINKLK